MAYRIAVVGLLIVLAGCQAPRTVIQDRPVTVEVPVTVPCIEQRPEEPVALRDQLSSEEWAALTVDQRSALIAAQALARKIFADRLVSATAGCQELP